MSYTYTTGQGVTALVAAEPAGTEAMSVAAIAIRQIKQYLNDATVGPQAKIAAITTALTTLQGSIGTSGVLPIGSIGFFGADKDLTSFGWFKLGDDVASRAAYPQLFAALQTRFGAGDGVTTFGLPKVKGRVLMGYDGGRNFIRINPEDNTSALAQLGDTLGTMTVTLNEGTTPTHSHALSTSSLLFSVIVSGSYSLERPDLGAFNDPFYYPAIAQDSVGTAGGGQPHNNLQPTACLWCYIKFQ